MLLRRYSNRRNQPKEAAKVEEPKAVEPKVEEAVEVEKPKKSRK